MEYDLTEEQAAVRRRARRFALERVAPFAAERDRAGEYPRELLRQLGEEGFLGYPFPETYGGGGGSFLGFCTIAEELAREDASASVIMLLNPTLVATPIMLAGDEERRRRLLPELFSGRLLGCFCLTEPEAGSDAAAIKTVADAVDDGFVLNGEKIFIQQGDVADLALVVCRVRGVDERPRTSLLLVEDLATKEGVSRRRLRGKIGIRAATTGRLRFENVRVGRDALVGEVGSGFRIVFETLDGGRLGIAAQALGIAQGAFERAFERACARVQFGRPIIEMGAIEAMLARMATEIEAARSLLYRAAVAKDAGRPYGTLAAMAKLHASRVANRVAYDALQIYGGRGFVGELSDVGRFWRDARITEIYEGTSQIQQLLITRRLREERDA